MNVTAEQIIRHFDLRPLAGEGGMFRQSYLAAEHIPRHALPPRYPHDKPLGTAIYYLLTDAPDSFSELHTLPTDEVYHFYAGDPVDMLLLYADGRGERVRLGPDFMNGQHVQLVVPRGVWQGSRLAPGGRWALMGTTMAPGYTDSDYMGGERAELQGRFPQFAAEIAHLTRRRAR
jgi:predicted cupin superfamily sugar epimerase